MVGDSDKSPIFACAPGVGQTLAAYTGRVRIPQRALGRTGLSVSAIGLGTVKLGRSAGLKYAAAIPTDDQALALLARAHERGITLIDTAPAYGLSEERLGRLLPMVAPRDAWVISTKVGEEFDDDTGQSRFDFTPEWARASVERSLRRLAVEALDVVLVHSDGNDLEIIERLGTLEALGRMKEQGRIGAVGISTRTPEGAMAAIERSDVVMLTLNPRDRADLPAIRAAHASGVGVVVKKALLSGRPEDAALHMSADERARFSADSEPAGALIRFALSEPGVSSVVVGTTSLLHLDQAIDASLLTR